MSREPAFSPRHKATHEARGNVKATVAFTLPFNLNTSSANALKSREPNILIEIRILKSGACSKMTIFFQLYPLAKCSPIECPKYMYMWTGVLPFEHHTRFNEYVSQQSQIHFEDQAIYMRFQ